METPGNERSSATATVAAAPAPILLVEDDPDIREALVDMLSAEGLSAAWVRNGAEALEYLRTQARPAVILLDWRMPVMDGEQFVRKRALEADLSTIPVVVLSADRGEAEKAVGLGVQEYVSKPVNLELLFRTLARFLPAAESAAGPRSP